MLFETLILVEFCLMFDKIDCEKHMDILLVLVLILVFFLTLETFKIVLPSRRNANFHRFERTAAVAKSRCMDLRDE